MKKISVIIPIYNAERFLDDCINSVLEQTYKNFELILVDDGSVDSSENICKIYAQQDERVIYIHKENGGVSSARNKGLDIASGEFIIFIDSDDIIKKEMFEQLMLGKSSDFVMCGYELYDHEKKIVTSKYSCNSFNGNIHDFAEKISSYLSPPFLLGPCFKLFKKNIIDEYQVSFPLELSYGEDAIFVLEYLMHCQTVEIYDYIGYLYRKHGKETLSSMFLKDKIDINYRINCLINDFLKKENVINRKEVVANRLFDNYVSYTHELMFSKINFKEKKKIFYDKYNNYKDELGKSKHLSQKIIRLIGKYKLFYPLIYIFKMKG